MIGLRTKFEINETTSLEIYQKPWSSLLEISPADKLNYIIVLNEDRVYTLIDEEGENDGFGSFGGAEQFARAYIKVNYDLESTRTIPEYKLRTGKRYNPETGDYIGR